MKNSSHAGQSTCWQQNLCPRVYICILHRTIQCSMNKDKAYRREQRWSVQQKSQLVTCKSSSEWLLISLTMPGFWLDKNKQKKTNKNPTKTTKKNSKFWFEQERNLQHPKHENDPWRSVHLHGVHNTQSWYPSFETSIQHKRINIWHCLATEACRHNWFTLIFMVFRKAAALTCRQKPWGPRLR